MKLELLADKVKVNGPKVDGGFTLSFEVGEYEQSKIAEVLKLKQNEVLRITVEQHEPGYKEAT